MGLAAKAAAAVSLLTGVWAAVAGWGFGAPYMCPNGGCPIPILQALVPVLGVLLALDSVACFIELRSAFAAGGALSAAIAAITLYNWAGQAGGEAWAALVGLAICSIALDLIALRPRESLKEQSNPMNLPVFG